MTDSAVKIIGDSDYQPRPLGGYTVDDLRQYYIAIGDNLSELEKASEAHQIIKVTEDAKGCKCALTNCQHGCPKGKNVPKIMDQLSDIDFKVLNSEFGDVMEKLNTFLEDFKDKTLDEFNEANREGYVSYLNKVVSEKSDLFQSEFAKLKNAIKTQLSYSIQAKLTGMACPAPCEEFCTLGTGVFSSVNIKMVEKTLSGLAETFGVTDEIAETIASQTQKKARADIIGAGPSGLQMAEDLRKQGFEVHVWDEKPEIGGVTYHGVPAHKIPKDEFPALRHSYKKMGINIHLNERIAPGHELFDKSDLVFYAGGVMQESRDRIPEAVNGFKNAKLAYDIIVEGTEAHLRGKKRKIPELSVLFGAGDTSNDKIRRDSRDTDKEIPEQYLESSYAGIIQANHDCHLLRIDRNLMPTGKRLKGEGYLDPTKRIDTPLDMEMKSMGYNNIYGAEADYGNWVEKPNGDIDMVFTFRKPIDSKFGTAKHLIGRDEYEPDLEVGAIRDSESRVVGIRMRDDLGNLHDFKKIGNNKFDIVTTEGRIKGEVDGTFEITAAKEAAFAYGAPPFAYKSEILNALGVVDGTTLKMNPNGTFNTKIPLIAIGDASGANQLIIEAQADATRKSNVAIPYLEQIAAAREIGNELDSNKKELAWKEAQEAPAIMKWAQQKTYSEFERMTGWGDPAKKNEK